MSENFGGPGEDGLTVMRYDRSIETGSVLYAAFTPYALVMLVIYPIGVPLQVKPVNRSMIRMPWHQPTPPQPLRIASRGSLAVLPSAILQP
eukprot:4904664-Prymnesium_polylepis.1